MDRITRKLLEEFLKTQELSPSNEPDDFELFCNFVALSNEYNKTFDAKTITVGSGNDTGIDGLAIIVNGHLIEDTNEIDDLLESNGYLEVTYIFIQAKSSSSFDTKEMRTFYFGVNDFFSENPKLSRNQDIEKASDLSEYILDNASDFRENPTCKTYYITTGVLNRDDQNIKAVVETSKEDLIRLNLFETVEANIVDANELGKLYRRTKNPVSEKITFVSKVALPEVGGIDESFYGVLPFSEFKKLIIDKNGNIRSVFDDNVRDFQGRKNPVNSSIQETLVGQNPSLFSVLNNGITIVADAVKSSANTLTLSDYQIVNGCQTSNVLYENRKNPQIQDISIPIRLIATRNEEIRAQITVSTNNQTAIKKEQLSAMSNFQKNLQHYYATIEGDGKLYYERRAKEYDSDRNVIKRLIITIANQLKSFSSMFNKDPHLVTTYFGNLAKNIGEPGKNLFEPDHCFAPYYLAGLAYYRLDSLFNSGDIDKRFKKVRFYLIMLVPSITSRSKVPPLNSRKKANQYCEPIIEKLNDLEKCKKVFLTAVEIIVQSNAAIDDKQSLKSRVMTDQILRSYNGEIV